MGITVAPYMDELKPRWDAVVKESSKGTFLCQRDFMEYHKDRFADASLMIFEGEHPVGVFAASVHGDEIRSHGGLSYGGLVLLPKVGQAQTLEITQEIINYFKSKKIKKITWKPIPHIYHTQPAEAELYALFRLGAKLVRVDSSTTVYLPDSLPIIKSRRQLVKKAAKENISVKKSTDWQGFMALLEEVLQAQHGEKPVHSAGELAELARHFPENIALYGAFLDAEWQAGAVVFDCGKALHTQYLANSFEGRNRGALDAVIHHLMTDVYADRTWFDFGNSNTENGRVLNEGLCKQKEGFGGRTTVQYFYELIL